MGKNRKLTYALSAFIAVSFVFFVSLELYHHFQKEHASNYQYRILINKETEEFASSEKNADEALVVVEKTENSDAKFYEHTKYGDLPRISPDGVRVFDAYAAHVGLSINPKEIRVALLIDDEKIENLTDTFKELGDAKVTFIVPHYLSKLEEVTKSIRSHGHEFFLQIPTQSSIPAAKKNDVSPFLANSDSEDVLEKLLYLLATAKHAIGIANVSSTLLTKSKKDMEVISDELSKRGAAFFDIEKTNSVLTELSKNQGTICLLGADFFNQKNFDLSKVQSGDSFVVALSDLKKFLAEIKDFKLISISSMSRNKNASI